MTIRAGVLVFASYRSGQARVGAISPRKFLSKESLKLAKSTSRHTGLGASTTRSSDASS